MLRFCPPHAAMLKRMLTLGIAGALSLYMVVGTLQNGVAQDKKNTPKPKKDNKRAKVDETPKRVVLVFPPDAAQGGTPEKPSVSDQLTDIITEVIKGRLSTTGVYRTNAYTRGIPTIKRAILEQTLNPADAEKPFAQDEKVKRLSSLAGYDIVVVSSIDDYQYDADKNQVSLVMSARLLDFAGGGKVVRAAGESLTGPEAPKSRKEIDVAVETARTLTETLMTQLLKSSKPAEGAGDKKP